MMFWILGGIVVCSLLLLARYLTPEAPHGVSEEYWQATVWRFRETGSIREVQDD